MRRGYMILRRPKDGDTPTTTIRLPWQQARVQFKTLTSDPDTLLTLYVLKQCKVSWEEWLSEAECLSTVKPLDVFYKIVNISQEIELNHSNINNGDNDNNKYEKFNFPEISCTDTYARTKQYLTTNVKTHSLEQLEKVLAVILSLVEVNINNNIEDSQVESTDSYAEGQKSKMDEYVDSKENSHNSQQKRTMGTESYDKKDMVLTVFRLNENARIEQMARLLSTLIVFWPYDGFKTQGNNNKSVIGSSVTCDGDDDDEDALLEVVKRDRALFNESRASSITEHIQFVSKAIEHLGHELVYKK